MNVPTRLLSASVVKSTRRVSAFGMRSSIQRCFSSNGWSVRIVSEFFRIKRQRAILVVHRDAGEFDLRDHGEQPEAAGPAGPAHPLPRHQICLSV